MNTFISRKLAVGAALLIVFALPDDGFAQAANTAEPVVMDVALEFQNAHMSASKVIDPLNPHKDVRIGVMQGDTIQFAAKITTTIPLIIPPEDYVWSGMQSGQGENITIVFTEPGTHAETLHVRHASERTGRVTVMSVPFMTEEEWGVLHPHRVLFSPSALELQEEANTWMANNISLLGIDVHNGRADAARHAYWNAIMTVEWNAADAEGLATAHERAGLNNGWAHNESVMDLEIMEWDGLSGAAWRQTVKQCITR